MAATADRLKTFQEFWPFYVGQHQNPTCRALHYVGTSLSIGALSALAVTLNPAWILAALLSGYGFAWIGHFFVEKNRPATFTYPLWSLAADYKMFFLFITGRMGAEFDRLRAQDFRFAAA